MVFSSLAFIFGYLPFALFGFLVCARLGHRFAALWLVLASLAFYAYWRVSFLPLLLMSIAFNYGIGWVLYRTEARPRLSGSVLLFGVTVDLLALFYFKYVAALAASLGCSSIGDLSLHDIVLPLGISFFTFTQIGYLVDVQQGVTKTRDLLSYVLFVTFFPHLIAGPILHNREMMPQFSDPATYRYSSRNAAVGLTIFAAGLAKKVLLADPLSSDVAAGFAAAHTAGLSTAWYAVIAYSLQLYFDFSGYSDMAIGLARLFNIRFPQNFNSPYKATTVIDYWQRFHMTLTRFITMYIFSPLALWVARQRTARGMELIAASSITARRVRGTGGGADGGYHGAGWHMARGGHAISDFRPVARVLYRGEPRDADLFPAAKEPAATPMADADRAACRQSSGGLCGGSCGLRILPREFDTSRTRSARRRDRLARTRPRFASQFSRGNRGVVRHRMGLPEFTTDHDRIRTGAGPAAIQSVFVVDMAT